jgi:hypothetical protein
MYVYNADIYCDDCGESLIASLEQAKKLRDRRIIDTGDSDDYPQKAQKGETDSPSHCARNEDCLNRVDLYAYGLSSEDTLCGAEDRYVGALLSETLTSEGETNAYEIATEQNPSPYQRALHHLWLEAFPVLVDRIMESAERQGAADGRAAGAWVIDGNTTEETKQAFLKGFEEGDPAVYDALPSSPLSGEFADDLLPRDVLGWYGLTEDDWNADGLSGIAAEVLNAYEDGYSQGVVDEVERACRATLERTP